MLFILRILLYLKIYVDIWKFFVLYRHHKIIEVIIVLFENHYMTCVFIFQVTILKSVKEDNKGYSADAMIGLAIIYVVLALSNFIAPSVVNMLGARLAMIFGAATYA